MTISDIKALADEQGYSVSGNVKSLIIESFLEAQEKAVKGELTAFSNTERYK